MPMSCVYRLASSQYLAPHIAKHCHRFKRHYLPSEHVFPNAPDFSDVIARETVKAHESDVNAGIRFSEKTSPREDYWNRLTVHKLLLKLCSTKCWDLFIYDRVSFFFFSHPHYLKWKSNSVCLQRNAPLFMHDALFTDKPWIIWLFGTKSLKQISDVLERSQKTAWSLRFQLWKLAHPSCHPPTGSVFK